MSHFQPYSDISVDPNQNQRTSRCDVRLPRQPLRRLQAQGVGPGGRQEAQRRVHGLLVPAVKDAVHGRVPVGQRLGARGAPAVGQDGEQPMLLDRAPRLQPPRRRERDGQCRLTRTPLQIQKVQAACDSRDRRHQGQELQRQRQD